MKGTVSEPEFQRKVEALLRSERFIRGGRLGTLLRYLASFGLNGAMPDEVKVAEECFGQRAFTPGDSLVKVNISRLKAALAKYYANEGAGDSVVVGVHVRKLVAEDRHAESRPTAEQLGKPVFNASDAFFAAPEDNITHCVVTGEAKNTALFPLDGDQYNVSLGNLAPLSVKLRSTLEDVWSGRRRSLTQQLHPQRLGNDLAPEHFLQQRPASAYGCAALAFYLGSLPCARQPDRQRGIWLCDTIDYARRRFSAPLVRHVLRHMALPFFMQLDQTDAHTAIRISLQLTGALEESGRTKEAQACLDFGLRVSQTAGKAFPAEGTREHYALVRRRAQLLAERDPTDKAFIRLMSRAEEHTGGIEERVLSLYIDKIRRLLRQGTDEGLKSAHELAGSLLSDFEPAFIQQGDVVVPQRIAAHLGEILLLSGIAVCRLRPSTWKTQAHERMGAGKKLVFHAGHVLPSEYLMLVADTHRHNGNSSSVLLTSAVHSRREPVEPLVSAAQLVLKAVARLKIVPTETPARRR